MKGDYQKKSGYESPLVRMIWGILAVCSLLISTPAPATAASISADSTTIFRMMKSPDDKNLVPAFEYLRLSGASNEGEYGSVAVKMGGWGRVDLANKSYNDDQADTDLQYGYLSYRGSKNNLLFNAGRQFVAEGVATDRVDGLYSRGDLGAGFSAAAFFGSPVVTKQDPFKGGDLIYGGRIGHTLKNYYSLGLSAVRTGYGGSRIREEEGVDLWFHPLKQIDLVGKSSYNSITYNWMNHDYAITFAPLEKLRLSGIGSYTSYKDYFYQVTTSALSLTNGVLDPNEKVLTLGGSVEFLPVKYFRLTADYKNYDYDIAGRAQYYGGKATFTLPDSFVAGFSVHRMDGETDKLRYDQYRVFAQKKLGKVDLTADFFNVNYQNPINGVKNTYAVTGAVAYAITDNFRVAADINYLKDTVYDNAVTGFIKVTYAFDKTLGAEGGKKSEK